MINTWKNWQVVGCDNIGIAVLSSCSQRGSRRTLLKYSFDSPRIRWVIAWWLLDCLVGIQIKSLRLSQTVLVQAENTYLHTIVSQVSFCLCYPKYPSDFRTEESFKIQTKYWTNNNYKKCRLQNTASTYNWIIGFYIGFYMIYII